VEVTVDAMALTSGGRVQSVRTHVVFGRGARMGLAHAVTGGSEQVISLDDDLMAGPLGDPRQEKVLDLRCLWWRTLTSDRHYVDDLQTNWWTFWPMLNGLTVSDSLVVWVADNPTEYTGLLAVLAVVSDAVPVAMVRVTKSYADRFNRPDVEWTLRCTEELTVDRYQPLLDDAQPISDVRLKAFQENWTQLIDDDGRLRQRVEEKVVTVPEDVWDSFIIRQAVNLGMQHTPIPTIQLLGDCLARHDQWKQDLVVLWRLRHLIEREVFTCHGLLEDLRVSTLQLRE